MWNSRQWAGDAIHRAIPARVLSDTVKGGARNRSEGSSDDVGVPKGLGLDHVYCVPLGCLREDPGSR